MPINFKNDSYITTSDDFENINKLNIDYKKILSSISCAPATNTTTISSDAITIQAYGSEIAELNARIDMLTDILEKLAEDNGALADKVEALTAMVYTTQKENDDTKAKADGWEKVFNAIKANTDWNY